MKPAYLLATLALLQMTNLTPPALADWSFSDGDIPNAFIQSNNMTLELQCDRIRFAPAANEDAREIADSQALSFRFLKNGSKEAGAFQAGASNSTIKIVDNYPVEISFANRADYDFVLDQISRNAALNLSKIDSDVTYGIFDLKKSGAAIKALRAACGAGASASTTSMEAPEGVVYCGGGEVKRMIEYAILNDPQDQWDARVTVNGDTIRAMTAYSYFGSAEKPPKGFVVALLGEDRSEFLVFKDGGEDWLEYGDYTYRKCN